MAVPRTTTRQRSSVGGTGRAELAPTLQLNIEAARAFKATKLTQGLLVAAPGLTDEAEIARRIDPLRKERMTRLSSFAGKARKHNAQAAEIDRRLNAAGIDPISGDGTINEDA